MNVVRQPMICVRCDHRYVVGWLIEGTGLADTSKAEPANHTRTHARTQVMSPQARSPIKPAKHTAPSHEKSALETSVKSVSPTKMAEVMTKACHTISPAPLVWSEAQMTPKV